MPNVAKFMDNHVFKDIGRRQHQNPVQIDVVMNSTAPPAALLGFDANAAGIQLKTVRVPLCDGFRSRPGLFFHPGYHRLPHGLFMIGTIHRSWNMSIKFAVEFNFYSFQSGREQR